MNKILVTGGAGFIGSHLVDALMARGIRINVLDNLSSGRLKNVEALLKNENFAFTRGDLLNRNDVTKAVKGCDLIFHLAADPEVRTSSVSPDVHFKQNVVATYNLLEGARKGGDVRALVFTSSSTVYGDASEIPTSEDYSPLMPISVHGASKLACEALITAYARTYGFRALVYRLANITGPRSRHGVVFDFIKKLVRNPDELEILGDGTQAKSYLHVDDCIKAMLLGLERSEKQVEVFNVGNDDQVDVNTIARIVSEEMRLKGVKFRCAGGVDGGRGWKGDVKYMCLDTSKLKSLGWRPSRNSSESIKFVTKQILPEFLS